MGFICSNLFRALVHYIAGKGGFRCLCPRQKKKCCEQLQWEPDQRFGLILFQYLTDEEGNLIDEAKLLGRIKLWAVSEARYDESTAIHRKWNRHYHHPDCWRQLRWFGWFRCRNRWEWGCRKWRRWNRRWRFREQRLRKWK